MLSRDTIKTCESLRYSGYSGYYDSESAVDLWVFLAGILYLGCLRL